jgi:hypothetical protein
MTSLEYNYAPPFVGTSPEDIFYLLSVEIPLLHWRSLTGMPFFDVSSFSHHHRYHSQLTLPLVQIECANDIQCLACRCPATIVAYRRMFADWLK